MEWRGPTSPWRFKHFLSIVVIFSSFLINLSDSLPQSGHEYSQNTLQALNGLINEVGYNTDQHRVENSSDNSKALVVGITVCLAFIFAIAGIFIGIYFHVDDVVPCMNKLVGTSKRIQRLLQDDADDKKSLVGEDRWDMLSEQNNGFVHSCPAEAYPMRKCIQDKAYKSPHAPRKQTTGPTRDPGLEPIVNITSRSHSSARSVVSDGGADTISLLSWKSGTSKKSWKSQGSGRSGRSAKSSRSAKSAKSSKSGRSYRSSSSKRSSKSAKSGRSKSSDTMSQHSFYLTDSQSVTGIPGATMMGSTPVPGARVAHTTGAGSSFATGSGNSGSGFGGGLSGIGSGYHANVSGSAHGSNYGGSIHGRSESRSRMASQDGDDTMSIHSHSSRLSRSSKRSTRSKKSIGSSIGKKLRSRSRSRSESRDQCKQEDDVKFHSWGKYVNSDAGEMLF